MRSNKSSIGQAETRGRRRAEVGSAIRIVFIFLHLLRRNEYVLPALSPFCVNAAVNEFYFRQVAVRVVAAASRGVVRHAPCGVKLLV